MIQQVLILLAGLCWTYCQSALPWQCDNGKFQLEQDLPHSLSLTLHCAEWYQGHSKQQFRVDQKNPLLSEPAKHVCMDTPIIYNATIPSSGDHRPVRAEPGVYLYCPPQRWLNNIQHGSIVVLHHPCAPERQQGRLAALAQSCLPGYIMTPFPWLSMDMPLALVSWGQTLEMSHVTAPEVCDWLASVSSNLRQPSDTEQRLGKRYSLLLTHAAPLHRPKDTAQNTHSTTSRIDWLKSLRNCCEELLSKYKDGGTRRKEEKDEGSKRRERRGVLRAPEESPQDPHTDYQTQIGNVTDLNSTHSGKLSSAVAHSTSAPVETKPPATAMATRSTARPRTTVADVNPPVPTKEQEGAGEPKMEDEREEVLRAPELKGASQNGGEDEGGGGRREQKKVTKAAKTRSRTHSSHTHTHGQTHRKAGAGAGTGTGASGATSPRQRVKEDTEEQKRLEERETQVPGLLGAGGGRGSPSVERLPTPRTDEAVWAAAALGFLLVLLTLSVLHTRLYRHWRTSPSLYWHHSAQDYDSVADVIRRRLKLAGRRKRRVAPGRRHEAPLILNSSAEEDSD